MTMQYCFSKHSLYGMISKSSVLHEHGDFFVVRKSKKSIAVFPKTNSINDVGLKLFDILNENQAVLDSNNVTLGYMPESMSDALSLDLRESKVKFSKTSYSSKAVVSRFDEEFFKMCGKNFIEFRETCNKFSKTKTQDSIKIQDFLNDPEYDISMLIEWWNENRGKKYGWQRHSGYDTNFFKKFYEPNKDNLWAKFFYNVHGDLVGYSVVSKEHVLSKDGERCFPYLIRKYRGNKRNLCQYIDLKTFENVYGENNKEPFLIHWGASSGGVLKYKEKFPIYSAEKSWAISFKREEFLDKMV